MPKTFKFLKWSGNKAVALFVLTIVLAVAAVGSTVAYIVTKTGEVKNTFTPPDINIDISGDNIANKGDIPVYVRAAVVVNWVNETDGSILSATPVEGTDYTITYNTTGGWVKGSDGFWYYPQPLAPKDNPGASAPGLLGYTVKTDKEGYKLQVQVLSSAIQATPAEAVINSWTAVKGIDVNTGKLTIAQEVTE